MNTLEDVIQKILRHDYVRGTGSFSILDSQEYKRSIIVDTNSDILLLPLRISRVFHLGMREKTLISKCTAIYGNRTPLSTLSSAIAKALSCSNCRDGVLLRVNMKDNTYFYCGEDIIMDKNMIPLFSIFDKLEYNKQSKRYNLTGCIIKVHPKVFTDKKDPLCKIIKNTIIPTALESGRTMYCSRSVFDKNQYDSAITVEVSLDIEELFKCIDTPSYKSFSNAKVSKYILEHLDDN